MMTSPDPSFVPETRLEHALRYIEVDGLTLCLIRHASKRPVALAWNDPARVMKTAEAARAVAWDQFGMGVVHEMSQTGTLDVDHLDSCRILFAEYGFEYDEWMAMFPRIRSREGKDKILFRLPDGFAPGENGLVTKLALRWPEPTGECDEKGNRKLITVLELRGGDNQDVLPPSIHPDTNQPYAWARAPWEFADGIPTMAVDHPLLVIWAQWDRFKAQLEGVCPWALPESKPPVPTVQVLAPREHGDIIGQYNRSVSCAEILERNGYKKRGKRWLAPHSSTKIPGVIAMEGGKVYSHHGSDVLNTGHAHDAFSLLTVLDYQGAVDKAVIAAANAVGKGFGSDPLPTHDFSALLKNGIAKTKTAKPAPEAKQPKTAEPADYTFPRHLLDVPGMVGEIADFILSTSLFPQPVLALGASLAWCGAIMGRKVRTATDLRTNLYLIGVADSGAGKEHARKALKRLAVAAGMTRFIGAEKLASDQGLFALLEAQPSCLALLDEFGRTLRVLNNDRAPAHLQQLMTTLMELFGSADSYIIEKVRAEHTSGQAPRQVVNPNLCIYATTVPGRLYQGLTPDEITDGFLPRFLVFESDTPDPEMRAPTDSAPSGALIDLNTPWNDAPTNVEHDGNLAQVARGVPVVPRLIQIDDDANELLTKSGAYWRTRKQAARGTGIDALWARAYEHALRLSLIVGAGSSGKIERATASWACEMTDFLLGRAATQALACVATNEYEGSVQKVQAFIRSAGSVTLASLTRKFRSLKQKERDGIIGALMDAQQITVTTEKTNGRACTTIAWADGK